MRSKRRRLGVPILGAVVVAVLVASAGAASTNFFEPGSSPEQVGAGPQGVVLADLDGDGDRDLATANGSNSSVTVLRNNGVANFAPFGSSPEAAGAFPTAITAADIDGDTDPDLLVADQLDDAVYVFRNNGNANFAQPASSPEPAGDIPAHVAAADLDGDTDIDLAVANAIDVADGDVTILLNGGRGNFAPAPTSPEDAGNKPVSVAAADLDGDGDSDLATADQQSGTVTVFRNNGSANFNEAPGSPLFAGSFPQDIIAARLNGDAAIDLAVVNQGASSENVTILRNAGNATFTEPATSPEPVGGRPLTLTAADFDLDGDRDLATSNDADATVTILSNNGNANFGEPGTSPEAVGPNPRQVASGDLDGDTDPDLAIPNVNGGNVTILRNR
jgi:hypothetical protein